MNDSIRERMQELEERMALLERRHGFLVELVKGLTRAVIRAGILPGGAARELEDKLREAEEA